MAIRGTRALVTIGALVLGLSCSEARAAEGEATAAVRSTVDEVLAILRDPALSRAAHAAARRERIRKVVLERFGFEEMARRALGPDWQQRSPAERKEYTALFTDLLERSYIARVEGYSGGPIRYDRETAEANGAEVQSTITGKGGDRTILLYRLRRGPAGWQVYDLVIDGVSLVNNYRVQFGRVIRQSGYAGLVDRMRSKLEAERADERAPL